MPQTNRSEHHVSRRQFLEVSVASLATFSLIDRRCTGKNANAGIVSQTPTTQSLADLYREAAHVLFQARSVFASSLGITEEEVGRYYADLLDDYSPEHEHLLRKKLLQLSSIIQEYDVTLATQTEKDIREIMRAIARFYGGHPDYSIGYIDGWWGLSPFVVNQIWGPSMDVPFYMQDGLKIEGEKDALDYIERLKTFDKMISTVGQKLRADSMYNWIPPKVLLNRTLSSLNEFLKPSHVQHSFVQVLAEKLKAVDSMSVKKKNALVERACRNVADVVYPAYQVLAKQVQGLLDNAREESGIWAQPNGEMFYQDAIRQLGDSDLSAEEIHRLGLREVERIVSEMDALLNTQDYKEGSVTERMAALGEESRFTYPDSEEGRKMLLDDLRRYHDEVTGKMARLFKTQSQCTVEIRPTPVERQETAAFGEYMQPPTDGSRPGVFYINLRDIKLHPKFSLKTLTYHELNPGHHWQITLGYMQKDMPLLARISPFNGFCEGWALYAEKLAEEMRLYENDPFGNLGRLQAELLRAARLVVDTGLHHKRWTREQSIKYLMETVGTLESGAVVETERYMAYPGQALGYKLGMLKMLELRARAKTQLGQRFDLAEFHDVILLGGAMPLDVLENKIDRWIARRS